MRARQQTLRATLDWSLEADPGARRGARYAVAPLSRRLRAGRQWRHGQRARTVVGLRAAAAQAARGRGPGGAAARAAGAPARSGQSGRRADAVGGVTANDPARARRPPRTGGRWAVERPDGPQGAAQ